MPSSQPPPTPPRWFPLLAIFVLLAGGMLTTVIAYYRHHAERFRQAASEQLSALAELRVSELSQWRRERLGDARFYQGNADFLRLVQTLFDQENGAVPTARLQNWIRDTQNSHHYKIILLDAQGRPRHPAHPVGLPPPPILQTALDGDQPRLLDFYRSADDGRPRLAIIVPLPSPDAPDRRLGTMLWVLDPDDYLYPLLAGKPLQSESAETILLRRDGDDALGLSPSRRHGGDALGLRFPLANPAAPDDAVPHSDPHTLAVALAVPETPWTLLASIDQAEVEAPLRQRLRELLVTSIALLLLAAAAIALLWRRQQAAFLRERLAGTEALRETENRFQLLFNAGPDAVFLHEPTGPDNRPGRFIEVNAIACQRLGYTREELLRLSPADIDAPEVRDEIPRRAAALHPENPTTWEGLHITKNGRRIPVEISTRPVLLDGKRLWLSIVRDITERQKNQRHVARLNRTLALTNGINQTILRERDLPALLTQACEIAVREGGFRSAWIGRLSADDRHLRPVAHAGAVNDYLADITIPLDAPAESAGPASMSVRTGAHAIRNHISEHAGFAWADRALRHGYRSCASFPLVVAGQTRGMLALYADEANIFADDEVRLLDDMARNLSLALELEENETRRRQAEEALKTSEQRFRTILENMPGIAVQGFDREQRIIFWNQASTDLYGWAAAETLGRRALDLIVPEEYAEDLHAAADAWLAGGPPLHPGEFTLRRKDGSSVNVFSGFFLFQNDRGEPELFSLDIDLTARNAAQAELHLLHAALEATPTAWVITNADGIIQWVNPAFTTLTGYPPEEALGHTPHLLYSGHQADSFYENLWRTIQSGDIWQGELQNRRRDGSLYHEHMTVAPVRDGRGRITHFVAMKQDITEQKRLEHQLLRAQRLEGIGLLAGGIAHDLNNVLAPILLSVELLRLRFPGPENKSSLDIIEASARRGAGVVRQVLTFARGIDGERIQLRPKDLLREITFIAEETFPRSITVERKIDDDLPSVLGDPTQLHQILLNLSVNARDAMPSGGTLTLEARALKVTQTYTRLTGKIKPGDYVRLTVGDTGVGIPAEHLEKIFEPFFTTKGVGQGTGLGLSAVFGIVRSHGGFLEVSSHVGKGSTFHVYLPALTPDNATCPSIPIDNTVRGNGRGILLCDDEEPIRLITGTVLTRAGFTVYPAANGLEARRLHAQNHDKIQLALLDVMMPGETGDQTAIALRKLTPQLPVLFSTGMIGDADTEKILKTQLLSPNTALLSKPYDEAALLASIARLLHIAG